MRKLPTHLFLPMSAFLQGRNSRMGCYREEVTSYENNYPAEFRQLLRDIYYRAEERYKKQFEYCSIGRLPIDPPEIERVITFEDIFREECKVEYHEAEPFRFAVEKVIRNANAEYHKIRNHK